MSPAVVLGLSPTGLAAVRGLGRRGIPVTAFTSEPQQHGRVSRYCKAVFCPEPVLEMPAFADFLIHRAKQWGECRPVLIPTQDKFVSAISDLREELRPHYRFNLPPAPVVARILDKFAQYRSAVDLGIPVPATFCPRSADEIPTIESRLRYPAILKPRYTHRWGRCFPGKGFKVSNPDELRLRCEEILAASVEAVVQQVVPGPADRLRSACLYAACEDGEILAEFAMRKLRQSPAEFGVGTLVESIVDPELIALAVRFCRGIGYTGVAEIEFKRDEQDGALKLIEINPRLWEQTSLASACGLDFPYLLYRDLMGDRPARQTSYRAGVRWHDLFNDSHLCFGEAGNPGLLRWLKSWLPARAFSTLAADDPRPFLFQAAGFARAAGRSVLRRLGRARPGAG